MSRIFLAVLLLSISTGSALAGDAKTPETSEAAAEPAATPDEMVASLEAMCAETASARATRHEAKPLYQRLGEKEKIHALTREIVRLHLQNDAIKHIFEGLDHDQVAERVALFMIAGTGGPSAYEGPSLADSHRHMRLTNADFMAAGKDVMQAMQNLGYGQEEIDEMVCALVGLRDQVVLGDAESVHEEHTGHSHER